MKKLIFITVLFMFVPFLTFANGGDQRVVENAYFINLSRAPFTPRVGVETSFLASFVDLGTGKLIRDDVIARVRIAKVGERVYIFDKGDIKVQGGVMELKYTFAERGLHHMFVEFFFATNPNKIYEVPDFILDIQEPTTQTPTQTNILWAAGGMLLGVLVGLLSYARFYSKKCDTRVVV